jgi:hypothetical protein
MKISKILPETPRITKMDTDFAPAARPGAPTFGRTFGRVTTHDRVTISQDGRHLVNQFKNVADVLPVDLSKFESNVDPNVLDHDLGAS